jgi:hypothetical protein
MPLGRPRGRVVICGAGGDPYRSPPDEGILRLRVSPRCSYSRHDDPRDDLGEVGRERVGPLRGDLARRDLAHQEGTVLGAEGDRLNAEVLLERAKQLHELAHVGPGGGNEDDIRLGEDAQQALERVIVHNDALDARALLVREGVVVEPPRDDLARRDGVAREAGTVLRVEPRGSDAEALLERAERLHDLGHLGPLGASDADVGLATVGHCSSSELVENGQVQLSSSVRQASNSA